MLQAQATAAAYPFKTKDARLVLEDGSVWRGHSFGAKGTEVGEVVFNTSITGRHSSSLLMTYLVGLATTHLIAMLGGSSHTGSRHGQRLANVMRCTGLLYMYPF